MYDMIHIHFYLERRNSKDGVSNSRECPVILSCSYSSCRVKTYTGRKISEKEWDKLTERLLPVYHKSERFNSYLDLLSERVKRYFAENSSDGIPPEYAIFRKEIRKMVKAEVPVFFDLLMRFIEENSSKWSLSTYKKMKTFYSQLKEFSVQTNERIVPGAVNQEFADKLVYFYRSRDLRDTSIKKNLDLLKWFMNWGLKNGLVFNRDFENIRFSPVKGIEKHKDYFLKWDELCHFYEFRGLTKKEEWCRDIFCFIAFTGIRFSRINLYKKSGVTERYVQMENSGKGKILLNRFAIEIAGKYENRFYINNSLFPGMTLITFHRHLRSGAFKAGLSRSISVQVSDSSTQALSRLISAQTAINTYSAHAVRLDIPGSLKFSGNSRTARIIQLSGTYKLAEEKQIITSDKLYESVTSSGSIN
jgi:integrase